MQNGPGVVGSTKAACYPNLVKLFLRVLLLLPLAGALILAGNYLLVPTADTARQHFDVIVVLGYPANPDGTPSPEQRQRVLEGVREYRSGIAPRLLLTGGAAHNAFTEAHVMAAFAAAQGVPDAAIVEESQAQNTIQNIFYSAQLMHQHSWSSAEIVSSPSHLPRAALILTAFDRLQPTLAIDWRTHPAQWPPEYSYWHRLALYTGEAVYCLRLRIHGFPNSRFLPAAHTLR